MKRRVEITVRVPVDLDVELNRETCDFEIMKATGPSFLPERFFDTLKTAIQNEPSNLEKRRALSFDLINELLAEKEERIHALYNDKPLCGMEDDDLLAISDIYVFGVGFDRQNQCKECADYIRDAIRKHEDPNLYDHVKDDIGELEEASRSMIEEELERLK